jgi:PAS domain S-box-containing protein
MQDPSSDDAAFEDLSVRLPGDRPEAWLAAIVDSSDDAIIGKTLDGTIRSWNAGAIRIFGYTADEIIGQSIYTLIPPERREEEPEIVAQLARGERVDHFETVRVRKDGTRVEMSLSVSPIRDRNGRIVGAAKVARDITDAKRLRRAERELLDHLQELTTELEQQIDEGQSLQEELEQTNDELAKALVLAQDAAAEAEAARLEAESANVAKSRFLATMSHELRTPLNAILGYVDLLQSGLRGSLTAEQQQDLSRIRRSQNVLHRLIEDVLNFARLEAGKLEYRYEDVAIDQFLGTLEGFVTPRLVTKNLSYSLHSCPTAVVAVDRDKLEQILLNLLSNAAKFTDHGGIEMRCSVDEKLLRIDVRDTGRGIRKDLLDDIFEPFVQGDQGLTRSVGGTGLGLSISRQLARGMGGDVVAESEVGVGSTFSLILPRHRPEQSGT